MSHKNFRTYQLSVSFYRQVVTLQCPTHLRDQLLRAASSVSLNLAEGSAKGTEKDRLRFYRIAFGSLREVQAVFDLVGGTPALVQSADVLAAHLYKLVHSREG